VITVLIPRFNVVVQMFCEVKPVVVNLVYGIKTAFFLKRGVTNHLTRQQMSCESADSEVSWRRSVRTLNEKPLSIMSHRSKDRFWKF